MGKSEEKEAGGFFWNEETHACTTHTEVDLVLPISENIVCVYCKSPRIDTEIQKVFKLNVCKECRFKRLDFITKTTCRKEYLLQEEELATFPSLSRPNPHKGTWENMRLYLKKEIEKFSVHKFWSLYEIVRIRNERKQALVDRKKRKLKGRIRDLKRKTFLDKKSVEKHVHVFKSIGEGKTRCNCGLTIEEEEI
jgi:DNA-repair protein complementing XP-A cells